MQCNSEASLLVVALIGHIEAEGSEKVGGWVRIKSLFW
jgi:hypothetical protein